jgi:MoaA/NifB/PqqE/SkfB family radical SAM enzyme
MDLKLGIKAINEAAILGADWISLTGGEPFLEQKLMEDLIAYSNQKDLKTEVVTNGFWAKTPELSTHILESLKKHGLKILNLSIDDFHQEQIPINYIRNAYQAAQKLGIKIVIMTTTTKNSKITSKTLPELLEDDKIQNLKDPRIQSPNALLIETPITPEGRGKTVKELDTKQFSEIKCSEPLRDIGIGPKGEVYPCCGPLAIKRSLGNINNSNLEDILKKAGRDSIFTSIREGTNISGLFTSRCHACISLVS